MKDSNRLNRLRFGYKQKEEETKSKIDQYINMNETHLLINTK